MVIFTVKQDGDDRGTVVNVSDDTQLSEPCGRVELSRPVFTKVVYEQTNFRLNMDHGANKEGMEKIRDSLKSTFCPVSAFLRNWVFGFLPILQWIPKYGWRTDLVQDVLAGFTVGVMSIPQGMAYARLAGMPPVAGLYTNIIPTIVYFFLGTSRHAAIGPVTVLCLITSSIRYKYIPCEDCWSQKLNSSNDSIILADSSQMTPLQLGSTVAFLVGVFSILMGLFRLSFVANYLSDQLIGGFTFAAAVQVLAGQLASMFGIKLPKREGIGKAVMNFFDLFRMLDKTNVATFIIFIISFIILFLAKMYLNPRIQQKFKIPFPFELVIMIAGTLFSYFFHLNEVYGVGVVAYVPAGMPTFALPRFSFMQNILADSFILAVVTYSFSISLAKLFAKRNGYKIQADQEFYAYGFMNLAGSFFQCFNAGQSVARSMVYERAGAKSQFCGLLGTGVVIVVVIFLSPFLAALPHASLASIIVVACVEMFRNARELPYLFRNSKYDCAVYMVTLVSVVVLDVTYGLAIGVLFSLFTVVIRAEKAKVEPFDNAARLLYESHSSNDEKGIVRSLEQVKTRPEGFWKSLKIIKIRSILFYANADSVKNQLLSMCTSHTHQLSVVIVDFESMVYMDLMGLNSLKDFMQEMHKRSIDVYLCGCAEAVLHLMKTSGAYENCCKFLFPTLLDAVTFVRNNSIVKIQF